MEGATMPGEKTIQAARAMLEVKAALNGEADMTYERFREIADDLGISAVALIEAAESAPATV